MAETQTILTLCKGFIQLSLFFASLIRYNLFSLIYLIFLLISPFASFDKRGCFLGYNIALIICSGVFSTGHAAFQIALTIYQPFSKFLENCDIDLLWRQIGLQPLNGVEFYHTARLICPDPLVLVVTSVIFGMIWAKRSEFFQQNCPVAAASESKMLISYRKNLKSMGDWLLYLLFLVLLCSVAICSPSLLSSLYLLTFILVMVLWATGLINYQRAGINMIRVGLALYTGLHLICIFLYQFPSSQQLHMIRSNSTTARLLGLYYLIQSNCTSAQVHFANTVRPYEYAAPLLMLVFYFYVAMQIYLFNRNPYRHKYKPVLSVEIPPHESQSEPACLVDAPFTPEAVPLYTSSRSYGDLHHQQQQKLQQQYRSISEPPTSAIIPDSESEDYQSAAAAAAAAGMIRAPPPPPDRAPSPTSSTVKHEGKLTSIMITVSDPLLRLLNRLRQFLASVSYILTLITMMSWSVTYVSLCTLPFLLLACVLWVSPGTRRFTLTLSPLLVLYSTGLLVANFVFNFNLPELYLAQRNATSLSQIGLQTYDSPMITFASQICFCCVFYFTMWTFLRQKRCNHTASSGRNALELYMLRAATDNPCPAADNAAEAAKLKGMEKIIIEVMSKYSLIICCIFWVLMCSRSVVSISHVIVMAIFLYFIITFRLFYSFWRRQLIVCFWGIIIYSMLVLLVIYAYQFQTVPEHIVALTGIKASTLKEIGIEKYKTPQLFLNLLFPTSFIIVIMIHVKNFHGTFLELSNLRPSNEPTAGVGATADAADAADTAATTSAELRDRSQLVERPMQLEIDMSTQMADDSDDELEHYASEAATYRSRHGKPVRRVPLNARAAATRRVLRKDFSKLIKKANAFYDMYSKKFSPTLWRLLEVHWHRVVGLVVICTATKPTSAGNYEAANFVYVALLPLYLVAPHFFSVIYLFWSALLILGKMIYQLSLVHTAINKLVVTNCTVQGNYPIPPPNTPSYLPTNLLNNVHYLGFIVPPDGEFFSHIILYIIIVICLAFQHIIYLHQKKYYFTFDAPQPGIIFPRFTLANFEQFCKRRLRVQTPQQQQQQQQQGSGLVSTLLKFLANFGCYKFGLELCYTAIVVCSCLRLDIFSCFYMIFLLIFTFLDRTTVRKLWPVFRAMLGLAFLAQFCLACGYPPMLCNEYIWYNTKPKAHSISRFLNTKNFRQWFYLPVYNVPPVAEKLIADYCLLVLAACQHRVFRTEVNGGGPGYDSYNDPVWNDVAPMLRLTNSFMNSKSADMLNILFKFTFSWVFWLCPFLLLILGFLSFNIFSFTYILAAFYFIGKGHRFLLQDRKKLVLLWNAALGLNVFVVLCKCSLQLIGCSYPKRQTSDWMHQLFGIQCLNMNVFNDYVIDGSWNSTMSNPGIVMDMVCFVFLIVQKRVFLTKYFTEVRLDTEIQNSFTSKGARIMTISLRRQKAANQEKESKEVEYIRKKVTHLKSRKRQKRELTDHFQVVRSGTRDLFYTTDAKGNKVLTIDEPDEEPDPHCQPQPTAAENLIEQGFLKATEFAQKPRETIRKTISTLHQRRFSKSISMNDDDMKKLVAAGGNERTISASSDDKQSCADRKEAEQKSPIPEEEDNDGELLDYSNLAILTNSMEVPPPPTTPVCSPSTMPDLHAMYTAFAEVQQQREEEEGEGVTAGSDGGVPVQMPPPPPPPRSLGASSHGEQGDVRGDEKDASTLIVSCPSACLVTLTRYLLIAVRLLCRMLDEATIDYRKIKDQMMHSKLQAKRDRLDKAVLQSGTQQQQPEPDVELTITPYPKEYIQEDEEAKDTNVELLPTPITYGQALAQLMLLLQYLLFSRLTSVCYLAMVMYHVSQFTVFSLYYPLVVFMWGMLSVPHPTKRFWFSAIAYTMFLIVIKYVLQFTVIKNLLIRDHVNTAREWIVLTEWFKTEIGVTDNYKTPVAELVILGLLFLQRSSLKRYGLWNISRRHTNAMLDGSYRKRDSQTTRSKHPSGQQQKEQEAADAAETSADGGEVRVRRPQAAAAAAAAAAVAADGDNEEIDTTMNDPATPILLRQQLPVDDTPADDKPMNHEPKQSSCNVYCLLSCLTCHTFREFYKKISDPKISLRVDLYSWIFVTEFVSLLIIFFGYTAGFAGPGSIESNENIITYFSKEEIPLTLTLTLFIQFILILVDRGLFLTKSRRGKFFFHLFHVILLHAYLKFVLPAMSSPNDTARNVVIKIFYTSKCAYFALSAYQILSGYPSRVLGNFLCKGYNYLNLFSFKIYLLIPFLFELRSIMDWMLTNTALSISHWLLVEDIYSVIFVSKCWRRAERDYPTERAKNRSPCYKYCPGLWLIVLIVACIWAPLLWFSIMSNVFLEVNSITSCTSELSIGSFTPLYTLRTTTIKELSHHNRSVVRECFTEDGEKEQNPRILALLQSTTSYIVEFDGAAGVLWAITPPSRRALTAALRRNSSDVRLSLRLECLRSKDNGLHRKKVFEHSLPFESEVRESLIQELTNSSDNSSIEFADIGDRYLMLRNDVAGIEPLSGLPESRRHLTKMDIRAKLKTDSSNVWWWELQDVYDYNFLCPNSSLLSDNLVGNQSHNVLRFIFFSERSKSENKLIQAVQKVGMYGILSVFLISVARLLRSGIIPRHYLVMYVDMPHVDRIISLLRDIYLVRESQELELEEELFAKLLYLFRSPSMLIRYTQPPDTADNRKLEEEDEEATAAAAASAAATVVRKGSLSSKHSKHKNE